MTELTSISFPEGAQCNRSESNMRELARAKVRAQAAWETFCKRNASGLSEDEQIDREIESKRLCKALNDADYALFKSTVTA